MARIPNDELLDAERYKHEKINGDYFVKTIIADSNGNFISDSTPLPVSSTTTEYRQEIDTTDGNTTYLGWAVLGSLTSASVWKIKRITLSGTVYTFKWADGNTSFDNIWDNRSSLTYG